MNDNKIGQNIKDLRLCWDETQMDLANAIGANSPNTIANYEKGIRIPNDETKIKIAMHYGITVDDLVNSDVCFSKAGEFLREIASDEKKMNEMVKFASPVLCDEDTLSHPLFGEAFLLHSRILQQSNRDLDFTTIEKCVALYFKSYRSEKLPEALVNVLQILMILNVAYSSDGTDWYECLQDRNKLNTDEFIKKYILRDCSEDAITSPWKDRIDIKKLNEVEFESLIELKKHPQYNEVAEYYSASRYLFGTVDNGRTVDMNHTVGDELMKNFMNSHGEYAELLKNLTLGFIEDIEKNSQSVSEKDN